MIDLFSILSAASGSLGAQRALTATASNNLANANTPGYARQRADLVALLPAEQVGGNFIGRGAALGAVTQSRDRFLESQLPSAFADAAAAQAQADALSSVSALDPQGAGNLSGALGAFYASLRTLSQNAGDPGLRRAAVASASTLASSFNRTAQALAGSRDAADAQLSPWVDEANRLAAQTADLNRQIAVARSGGGEPNDLLDARQSAVDRLAQLTGARPVPDKNGNLSLVLADGTALVSGARAGSLSTQPDPANGGHLSLRFTRTDGSNGAAPALGGSMGGLLQARDGALKNAQDGVDQLAFDLASALNAQHRVGFGLDGSTGRDLFVVGSSAAGAAAGFQVDAAISADPTLLAASSSAAGVPGDGQNMLALIATERQGLSSGLDASATMSALTSSFGGASAAATAMAQHSADLRDHLTNLRESVSGVSIDEEMVQMQRAQRAFEAISKVIQTTDAMLETLLTLK